VKDYHLGELKVALDPQDPRRILPPSLPRAAKVLDVGCGAGQSLIAAYPDRVAFGIDVDVEALQLGRTLTSSVCFAAARAESLPFESSQFDLVFARVSLP
jgi:SAM-dependent methyltransferase